MSVLNGPVSGKRFRFTLRCGNSASMPTHIALLAERCARFLDRTGAGAEEANSVQTALEELLTNIAKFGAAGENPPPILRRNRAAAMPAGPAPTTTAFFSVRAGGGVRASMNAFCAASAAISFAPRIFSGES